MRRSAIDDDDDEKYYYDDRVLCGCNICRFDFDFLCSVPSSHPFFNL